MFRSFRPATLTVMELKPPPTLAGGPIVVAVEDAALHPEAVHLAAATGRQIIDAADTAQLARYAPQAFAVLIDASRALTIPPAPNVFTVGHGVDALAPGTFVLPEQAADLLGAIGKLALSGGVPARAGRVVAVVGASGGAGASVTAAAISRAAAQHDTVTLIDANRLSGGLDLLLGIEHEPGARWGEIAVGEGAIAREDIRRALPSTGDRIAVLTFSRAAVGEQHRLGAEELGRVVEAVSTEGVTVVDTSPALMPPRCDLAVIVLRPELRAAAAASRLVAECNAAGLPSALIVRENNWSALTDAEIEHTTRSRVLTRVRDVRALTQTVERSGLPARLPRHLARAAETVLGEVA